MMVMMKDLWWSRWWHWGAAVVVVLEVVAAHGGEWFSGSTRPEWGECLGAWPEMMAGSGGSDR
nr:hypothetical protein [Tanacetum cinerariifolium]